MLKRSEIRIRDPYIVTDKENQCYYMYGTTDLVPGSLRYTTSEGITKRILNKDGGDFGVGTGNTFAFTAPAENIKLTADFVSTADTDFAFGTVGTAVHQNEQGLEDGIRFLNRLHPYCSSL